MLNTALPQIPLHTCEYRQNGYMLVDSLLNSQEIAKIKAVIDELIQDAERTGQYDSLLEFEKEPVDGRRIPRRIFNPYEQHEAFRTLAASDKILSYVRSLLGPDIALQHSKLNMKPRKVGAVVEWHQDYTYFPHSNDSLVGVLIYLDDACEENGCLQVLSGQHHRTFNHALPDGSFAGMITEMITEDLHGPVISLPACAGSAIFLHPFTPHRSSTNNSDSPRSTLIFEYRAADAFPIYTGSQLVGMERLTHHLCGEKKRTARFGGPEPEIYTPKDIPKSLYELQDASRSEMNKK